MSKLYAAFGEVELPCDIGTPISGWIPPIRRTKLKMDPIKANIAALKNNEKLLIMVSLDILFISTEDADEIRASVAKAVGTSADAVMVSATHNHCAPAATDLYGTPKNEEFVARMKELIIKCVSEVCARLEPAVLGSSFVYENDITWNRRYIMRNGYSFAHPQIDKTDVLCAEGPIDPQVGVVCVRDMQGVALGYVVNFACHPLFYGGECIATANFPGVLSRELKKMENPNCVTVFINGAAGDVSHSNPFDDSRTTMESVGIRLAERSREAACRADYTDDVTLDALSDESHVLRRSISEEHLARAKRVVDGEDIVIEPSWHPITSITNKEFANDLIELSRECEIEPEMKLPVQVMRIGNTVFATAPCELFVRLGMEIKLRSKFPYTYIAGYTNGYIGYVGTTEAYIRGGYETTPCGGSFAAPDSGERIINAVCGLIDKL